MNYCILIGSHRTHSQSTKVGQWINYALHELDTTNSVSVIDLCNNPLPLRNDRFRDSESSEYQAFQSTWGPIQQQLQEADAFVVISPEWNGMVAPGLKNFFLYCTPPDLGHKPALIVTVSSSRGGRYPINELRTSGYKNTRIVYLPEHIYIDQVESKLNDHTLDAEDKVDQYIRQRLQYALKLLGSYSSALQQVRESSTIDYESYPNGM